MSEVKQEVRQFYDQVGWQLVGTEVYQNARYEDLRPVARPYIHDCHLRVGRHLKSTGRLLLDAGSGPVQYPEYLEYSRGYEHRVCADISITALKEARRRLGPPTFDKPHGLYVVADVANLPFKADVFDGVVSLHTIHHLPEDEHLQAFNELRRVLAPQSNAVVVNGWDHSTLMRIADPLVRFANWLRYVADRLKGSNREQNLNGMAESLPAAQAENLPPAQQSLGSTPAAARRPASKSKKAHKLETHKGTHTEKHDAAWVKSEVGAQMPIEILVWRSVTVRFTRALIHPRLGGRFWLRLIYCMEERYPHFFGEKGKYPLIVIRKV
jgi:ubiquinone/menaquinone biosynthesis C-methylase UbiE